MAPSELGVASDVFALGLIYTEYLTGAPPPSMWPGTTSRRWRSEAVRRCASPGMEFPLSLPTWLMRCCRRTPPGAPRSVTCMPP